VLPLGSAPTTAPGFPDRTQLTERYAERSGLDLSGLDFYVALGYWKLAIILEGVYARYAQGGYGETDEEVEQFPRIVEELAESAARTSGEVG
jgi:aminoglycoside phosphotransferase (APT) family kinase protein